MLFHKKSLVPLIISAFSLAISFYYCWVMAPLFFAGILYWWFLHNRPTFFNGFLWGVIFFTIHGLGPVIYTYQQAAGWMRFVLPVLYVCLLSLYSGFWFFLMQYLKGYKPLTRMLGWSSLAVIHFWCINTLALWPLLGLHGQVLAFPLAPLTSILSILSLMFVLTKWGLLFLILLLQVSAIEGWYQKRLLVITAVCVLILGWSVITSKKGTLPEWFKTVSLVKGRIKERKNPYKAANKLTVEMQKLILEKPETKVIITPEGYFPFFLKKGRFTKMWQENVLGLDKILILGAHQKKDGKAYNTLFMLDERRIIQTYEKTTLIPFFESSLYNKKNKGNTFYKEAKLSFSPSNKTNTPINLYGKNFFLPVICIELFWLSRSEHKCMPLICIANDFFLKSASQILLFSAQVIAITEKRPIIYAANYQSYFIDEKGYLYT